MTRLSSENATLDKEKEQAWINTHKESKPTRVAKSMTLNIFGDN